MVEESASSVPVPLLCLTSKICAEHYWLHPFRIADSAPQTSAQVESHLQETVEAIDVFAQCHQLPPRHATMIKVRKQLPALAALVDFWWEGVRRDLAHAAISPMWGRWAAESLLPLVYWEHQVAHTRCARRKAKLRQALEAIQVAFGLSCAHPMPASPGPQIMAYMGYPPGESLSARLVSCGGP